MTAAQSNGALPATAEVAARRLWWIAAAVTGLAVLAELALYGEAVAAAVNVWNVSATYTHCYLIAPISAYVMWERRHLFAQLTPRPYWPALLLIPVFAVPALVADMASILEGQQLALMLMIQATLLAVLGWRVYKAFLFPFLYLFFLVPSGDFLVPALQDFTAAFSVRVLQIIGIPVYSDGIFITIPTGYFEVAEACAGLRFLIAAIAFGFLYANLVYSSYVRRIVFIALSVVIPIIANGFRAFGIIWLAHISENQIAVAADHLIYGWVFFSIVLLIMIIVGMSFRDARPVVATPEAAGTAPASPFALVLVGAIAVLLAGLSPAYAAYVRGIEVKADLAALQAPAVREPWRPVEEQSDWKPVFEGADATIRQAYEADGRRVELFVAFYRRQRDGAEAVAFANRVTDGEIWQRSSSGGQRLTMEGRSLPVRRTQLLAPRDERKLVLHWYWIDERYVAGKLDAKLAQARAELLSGDRAAAAIALAADYELEREEALAVLEDFLAHAEPLAPILRRAAGGGG